MSAELGSEVRLPVTSEISVSFGENRFGFGWLRMCKAGKFCHARRVLFSGQEEMYGASKVQAHDCGIPVSNQTGIG